MRSVGFVCGVCVAVAPSVSAAQSAVRDLPDTYEPGGPPVVVGITIDSPGSVAAVGVEDQPPLNWAVSSISHSGFFDAQSRKVKWGPFFAPSIPATISYELAPPQTLSGLCFSGTVSFDGLGETIGGEACVPGPVPAVSEWALLILALLVCTAATVVLSRRSPEVSADSDQRESCSSRGSRRC